MTKEYTNIGKKRLAAGWFVAVAVAILCLVVPECLTLTKENKTRAYKASDILISELEQMISESAKDSEELQNFLKETYLNKADTVAYVLSVQPFLERDPAKLQVVARMMGVDEIHLFTDQGILYGGTVPRYFGLSLDSGEQIRYFLPMLTDRSLRMSQSVEPNTAEGRKMLYAMCWNDTGTRMIQVGVSESRFPAALYGSDIAAILARIPYSRNLDVYLTDVYSEQIQASTDRSAVGETLKDVGIFLGNRDTVDRQNFQTGLPRHQLYCSAQNYGDYRIVVAQYKNEVDANVPITMVTFTEYLLLVFIAMSFVLNFMYDKFIQQRSYALRDTLTGMFNRREYENTLEEYNRKPMEDNLIFVSLDVNGLKKVNDQMGHSVGDELLQGAAYCIEKTFSAYGKTFRYGGDEFVAIVYMQQDVFNQLEEEFRNTMAEWSREHGIELKISMGAVGAARYPDVDIHRLANLADQKMYQVKAEYYAEKENDRRGNSDEIK